MIYTNFFKMSNLLRIVLIFAILQVSVRCIPIPEKNSKESAVIIVDEKKDFKTSSSSSDVTMPRAESDMPVLSPESMTSDAALGSLLQIIQKSLLESLSSLPPEIFDGLTRVDMARMGGDVEETVIAPGAKLRVIHRTYAPPTITSLAAGNVDGKNVNVNKKQIYTSQNFSVLQRDNNGKKEEILVPDINDVGSDEELPKDVLNDLKFLEFIRNKLEI